jgi:glycosyltransferase involved in cell wall biosynthesis
VIPCGVNLEVIKELPREVARTQLNRSKPMVLFSGPFTTKIKNPDLAKAAMIKISEAELVELKGYTRQEVNLLMNAADCLLMTSDREGSPQVIKEAMACGTPIVSVDVGDVKDIIGDTEGCYIAKRNSDDIADKIRMALSHKGKTKGRQRIIDFGLNNDIVAKRLLDIYKKVLKQ